MTQNPNTRPSLILRLQNGGDASAWDEFVAIYRPIILRLAEKSGLQLFDAEDVAQKVLLSVSQRISEWKFDPERARFRTWLARVVRNSTINAIVRRPIDRAIGGTTCVRSLNDVECHRDDVSAQLDFDWRLESFRWAATQVKQEVHPATWDAFWLTAVERIDPAEVAREIGKSVGAVYVARSRVMQKIQSRLRELDGTEAAETESPSEGETE